MSPTQKSRKCPKRRNPVAKDTIGGENALRGGPHGKTRKAQRKQTKTDLQKKLEKELKSDKVLGENFKGALGKYNTYKLRSYIRGMLQATQRLEMKEKLETYLKYI